MIKIVSNSDIEAVIIPKESIQDPELSLRDIGLLTYILSLSNDWNFSIIGIQSGLLHDGNATQNRGVLQ